MAKYNVRVTNEFSSITTAQFRPRAGIQVPVGGEGWTGELSDAQLKEIEDDQYLVLTEVGQPAKPATPANAKKTTSKSTAKPASEA